MTGDERDASRVFVAVPALGAAMVGALLWAAGGWSAWAVNEDVYPWPVKAGLLCAALALQILARRRPAVGFTLTLALVLADLPFGPSVPLWIALSDLIYLATALGSERLVRVVAGVSLALTVGAAVAATALEGVKAGVYATLILVALTWSPIGYARALRAYRKLAAMERQESEARRANTIAQERRRLARELHDTVAGHLSAVAILADAAQRTPQNPAVLQSIRSGSLAALEEMRATINLLTSPDDAAVRTTLASLEPLIATASAADVAVRLRVPDTPLPTAAEAVLTRILGEVITNATKHAPGAPLEIVVDTDRDELTMTATNPLPSTAWSEGSGDGLRNIAFRAESVGGSATAGPHEGAWVVRASVPMEVAR
ncbi:sensor histidine kinase [Tsukamurella spumae]|uniref:histidine kinase n=1 Tax=Tsukamurella spumae TaxID=44753 RepID=A0A846X1D7_9ACTN|nr:histidine kinase [Tsukamurella spumae]NKY18052.1 histidine kinase [Tsukamurella spumae]